MIALEASSKFLHDFDSDSRLVHPNASHMFAMLSVITIFWLVMQQHVLLQFPFFVGLFPAVSFGHFQFLFVISR